jgi:hypothetical protein
MATAARARLGTRSTEAALCDAPRVAYATGLALITVSSANWPSPTLGCRSLSEVSSGQLG